MAQRIRELAVATISLQEAQADLGKIILQLQPGEEIMITDQGLPLAQVKKTSRTSWPCKAGSAKNDIIWISPDFDSPLDDFQEYME